MGKRILIVDDSSLMRKIIRKALETGEHEIVGEAKSGSEGIEMYNALQPNLVTMDITMRGMDGLAAAREILNAHPSANIIFLSNLNEDQYSDDARRLGAKGYLNKHRSQELLALIETL